MANPVKNLDELRRLAEQQLRVTTGWSEFELIHRQSNRGRGDTLLHEFVAVRADARNAPSKPLYLDEEGKLSTPVKKVTAPAATVRARLARALPCDPITIFPDTNYLTLNEGDTFSEVLTVHIPPNPCCMVDVYFLADLTGSMAFNGVLSQLASDFGTIVAQLGGGGCDLAYGVGYYKDFGSDITDPLQVFVNQQGIDGNTALAQAAVNAWPVLAGGGDDDPEAQFYAFDRLAAAITDTTIGINWRPGARKIIVWIGDYPGHDPICQNMTGLSYDITETTAINALISKGIRVLAFDLGSLDADPLAMSNYSYTNPPFNCPQGGSAGQASRIAGATFGSYTPSSAGSIAADIVNYVTWALGSYASVSLVPAGGTAPFVTVISPVSHGPLDPNSPYDLPFDVLFTGVKPCDCCDDLIFTGTIDVVVDGAVVAQKRVEIKVPKCPPCPGDPKGDSPCDDAAIAANNELQTLLGDKEFFMTATPACSGLTDPADISKACSLFLLPDVRPCFFIKWGDGSRDQIETEDFEVVLLTVCNPYSNLSFGHLLIPKIEVTDALGNPVPLLPDGTESVIVVPSRMICFEEIPPCTCRSFELALKTVGAPEGPYKLKFSYCLDVCFTAGPNEQEFEFELITS